MSDCYKQCVKMVALLLLAGGLLSCTENGGDEYVAPDSGVVFTLGHEAGSTDECTLSFSEAWQITVPPDGFRISPESGPAGESVLTVTAEDENGRIGERESSFTIFDGSTEAMYRIIQKGTPGLVLSTDAVNASDRASEIKIELDGNIDFQTSVSEDWLEVLSVTHSDPQNLSDGKTPSDSLHSTVLVGLAENTSGDERSAVVTFTTEAGTWEVKVDQAAPQVVDWEKEFFRSSAFLRFTATWCYNCPYMAEALEAVNEEMPDRIVPICMHSTSSEGGLGFWKVGDYEELYGVSGYPYGVVNTFVAMTNNRALDEQITLLRSLVEEALGSYPARTGISAYSTVEDNTVKVDVTVAVKEKDDYGICVFLMENGIIYPQKTSDGTVYDYEHNSVVRAVLTEEALGDPLPAAEAGETVDFSVEAEIPRSVTDPSSLTVAVAVVRPESGKGSVLDGHVTYLDLGYICDNVVLLPADGFVEFRYEE